MLSNTQINRLLTPLVASMVVISALGQVEVRMPQHEMEVIVLQLSSECRIIMSDRAGQQTLTRLLRGGKAMTQKHHTGTTVLPAVAHEACPPAMLTPGEEHTRGFAAVTINPALLAPAVTSRVRTRSPSA